VRITYLHQYFTTPDGATGTRSYQMARRLVAHGHRVTMICSDAQLPEALRASRGVRRTTVDGIELRIIPVAYANEMGNRERIRAFAQFAIRASFEAARSPADVVIASSTPLTIALPGIVGRVARRAPLVFEVRDLWPDLPIAVGALEGRWVIASARLVEWVAYHAACHVIALSPGMVSGVERRGVPRSRISLIPNGCDLDVFGVDQPDAAAVRASVPGLAASAPLIVYTGALGRINGVQWLADLAAALRPLRPDARFLIVGRGQGRDALVARARERGVHDETLFLRDPIPKRAVPALLSAATVATALFEPVAAMEATSSNKFFDALAAGRPLLINYGGWHRDLIEDHAAGLAVSHDDVPDAARRVAAFLGDPERVAAAGRAARALAEAQFDRDTQAERFMDVVEAAAHASTRAGAHRQRRA
jgi:glycosyltransferase involved in cell wall biosynthesis